MELKTLFAVLVLACTVGSVALPTQATDMYVNIKTILISGDDTYGGCMAKINPIDAIATQAGYANGLGTNECSRGFVTFDCVGAFPETQSKAQAQNKLSASQLAYVTGKRLYVKVNASRKHNGYCLAEIVQNEAT